MAALAETVTAGGPESSGALNDLIAQLWPNINVAGCRMIKEIVEPMLASMLPGPLSSLHFVKLDLGPVPIRVSRVGVLRTPTGGIQLDMDVVWQGKCDIDLDGTMIPKLGVERVQLNGRLSVLLAPLTNIIPLIGAAQVAFINTPSLKLDFTGAADIADLSLVKATVRNVILGVINSMAVLPNRYLVKLDANTDFFKTYLPHIGVLRLTVVGAHGLEVPKGKESSGGATGKISKLLAKVGIKDTPDCYCKVKVGAESEWRTSTKSDSYTPEWNETHDFLVSDFDQTISVDVDDDDLGPDHDIGEGSISVRQLLRNGGEHELGLENDKEASTSENAKVSIRARFFNLTDDAGALSQDSVAAEHGDQGDVVVGLATILVASALNLQGQRDELKPSVQVKWGSAGGPDPKKPGFTTATKTYAPGTDIFNPAFDQAFRVPVTREMLANPPGFEIALLNGPEEITGQAEVPFEEVLGSPGCVKEGEFDVGGGVLVRASISLQGLRPGEVD